MVYSFIKCTMSTEGGKFILYKSSGGSLKMVTKEVQDPEENAWMYKSQREKGGKIQFALCFHGDNVEVAEGELKMTANTSSPDSLGESYWFEKVNIGAGEYYALQAVSKPQVYLSAIENIIVTCSKLENSLLVRVEKI